MTPVTDEIQALAYKNKFRSLPQRGQKEPSYFGGSRAIARSNAVTLDFDTSHGHGALHLAANILKSVSTATAEHIPEGTSGQNIGEPELAFGNLPVTEGTTAPHERIAYSARTPRMEGVHRPITALRRTPHGMAETPILQERSSFRNLAAQNHNRKSGDQDSRHLAVRPQYRERGKAPTATEDDSME